MNDTDPLIELTQDVSEPYIVAEISKNWRDGVAVSDQTLISQRFEHIINTNRQRGYKLLSFQLVQAAYEKSGSQWLCETIIAVFVLDVVFLDSTNTTLKTT